MEAGNQTLLKRNNQKAIIDYIITNGPISRADLSKVLKISKPTVSANVTDLMEMNLLKEIGYSETDIGKKPMLVDFNKNCNYVLALDFISYIAHLKISVAVCNLYCEPVFIDTIHLPMHFSGEYVRQEVPRKLLEFFEMNQVDISKIGKLVITAPTIYYDEEHIQFECMNGDFINLAEIFFPWFQGKIAVKNDVNLAALGEKHFGVGKEAGNLFFAWIGLAVGGGIILNGELYEGVDGTGGELASSTVYDDSRGEFVFLKDMTSMDGIRDYIQRHPEEAKKSQISGPLLDGSFYLDMIIEAAQNNDTFSVNFARHIARAAACVIANVAYTMDMQMVIVGGEYTNFGSLYLNEIREAVERIPYWKAKVTTPFYTNSAMYGAFKFGADSIISGLI